MKNLYLFLLALVVAACAAIAVAPVFAQPAQNFDLDKPKLQKLVNQVKDPNQRAQLQALLDSLPRNLNRAQLQAVALQLTKIMESGGASSNPGGTAPGASPKVLALYDAPVGTQWDKLGFGYAIMLRNLLGHFNAQVDLMPVSQYQAGALAGYDATFYLGAIYDNPIPDAFLADASTSTKPLVWFKYNLWQLAWNTNYPFQASTGIQYLGLKGMNATPSSSNPNPGFFDTVKYKNLDFTKYYAYDAGHNTINADPDLGWAQVADATKATAVVNVANAKTGEQLPYVLRSGNFWYVADLPFSFIGPRDRYLVFADLLHDMLGIQHAESHRAMVRLEDVGALVSVESMKKLSDYLAGKHVPFSVATIPHYVDALGAYNGGTPQTIPLSQATNLKKSLDYALRKGGEIVMHGYTHQYGTMRNPNTGVSGDDYEFWNIVDNVPVPEDSTSWALGRLNSGLSELRANGYTNVQAWEMPHYQGSALSNKAVPQLFTTTYQRVVYYTADKPDFYAAVAKDFAVGQIFPYIVSKDYYGQRILPESLGNIEYDIHTIDPTSNYNYTADDILTNAKYALAVRDGFASYFFHPFWLEPDLGVPGFEDFKKTVEGITQLGFTWVAPSALR